ncbi:hypothetical protein COU00_03910 [Candidatus Falkowbacteria bacterium CG10_big_fil_rev_8_21_14_0_10_43_11]|uniref:Uncharacterized protein n=1 Tax=Candidatus Falkowbacteria bacterium CG10_big_fil_rev_8_21_14_0_10_43_11 TaxID=1974568 RepID=A0A2M6WL53_9BACT|nr:MAG: hypothetical protein COU00_03910 [Candidatus Falkowbacteria bacterium CG10_big_fil_rev_8_21_14_0_10_43_11]
MSVTEIISNLVQGVNFWQGAIFFIAGLLAGLFFRRHSAKSRMRLEEMEHKHRLELADKSVALKEVLKEFLEQCINFLESPHGIDFLGRRQAYRQ